MTSNDPSDSDQAARLRKLMQSVDPASSLTPLRSDQLTRLTEYAMTNTSSTTTESTASPSRAHSRVRRLWPFAGGLAALGAAAIALPLALGPAGVTSLDQPASGGPSAMCATVTPDAIAGYDTAFRATVTSIDNGTVTLTVTDRLNGSVSDTVTVAQGEDQGVDGEPISFINGASYLISTQGGVIVTCGVSGEDTPELDALYDTAFNA